MQRAIVPTLALSLLTALAAQDESPPPKTDPLQTLAAALARAKVHNKRVLACFVEQGQDLALQCRRSKALGRPLLYEFEVVQFEGVDADAMATELKFDDAFKQRPALMVLAADRTRLLRQTAADLLVDGELQAQRLLEQLKPQYCPPVDAEQKLTAALVEAKKTGRNVFIRFDAPW
ncbi:MAG: hypothetical protein KDC98_06760 [Planctomycetes bacterium]|nr:hypothetical protein [Planctomycetota bacterium]